MVLHTGIEQMDRESEPAVQKGTREAGENRDGRPVGNTVARPQKWKHSLCHIKYALKCFISLTAYCPTLPLSGYALERLGAPLKRTGRGGTSSANGAGAPPQKGAKMRCGNARLLPKGALRRKQRNDVCPAIGLESSAPTVRQDWRADTGSQRRSRGWRSRRR